MEIKKVPVVTPQPDKIKLTLPLEVAETLLIILRNIGGAASGRRGDADKIRQQLEVLDVRVGARHPDIDGIMVLSPNRSAARATLSPAVDAYTQAHLDAAKRLREDKQKQENAQKAVAKDPLQTANWLKDIQAKEERLLRPRIIAPEPCYKDPYGPGKASPSTQGPRDPYYLGGSGSKPRGFA